MIQPNQILNDTYRIESKLGTGGGGIVYKAYHLRLQKYVAVKLVKDEVKGIINERAETDILKRLKHEGLPQVYDFINDGEDIYTVMEYIDGASLSDVIARNKKIPYAKCLEWAKELTSAVAYLHSRKPPIIHSDIKPSNIMITAEGKVCLIDFNISSVFDGNVYTVGSSDGYSPPEQYLAVSQAGKVISSRTASNKASESTVLNDDDKTMLSEENIETHLSSKSLVDTRSDVYSIGAVMYSMITGLKPANSKNVVTPLNKIDENIPEGYIYIVEKAMKKEKSERFSSAAEMLEALNKINTLDKRYKAMRVRQMLMYVLCLVLLSGSIISTVVGTRLMEKESDDTLTSYVNGLYELSEGENYESFSDEVTKALSEYPESLELKYFYAYKLYIEKDYENAQKYISENILDNIHELSDKMKSDVYFMCADICFREEDYEKAVPYYEKAVQNNSDNADIYRDYAIALAKTENADAAAQILEKAINSGLEEDYIYLVNGEIQFSRGEYKDSVESFKNALEITENDDIKLNAYLNSSKAYDELSDGQSLEYISEKISILEKARTDLPAELLLQVNESLAQGYIDYGDLSGKTEYHSKAVTLLDEIRKNGMGNYRTDMNIAVLLNRIGNYKEARNVLIEMLENEDYKSNCFKIYALLAYTEIDIQGELDNAERDYSVFDEYYAEAEKAYEEYKEIHGSDPEMDKLKSTRSELVSLGWL